MRFSFASMLISVLITSSIPSLNVSAAHSEKKTTTKTTRKVHRYIIDELPMVFRTGPTSGYRSLKGLKTGDPVEVLAIDEKHATTQVKTRSGKIGWVLSRYLVNTEGAKSKLKKVLKQLAQLNKKTTDGELLQQRLKQQLTQISERNQQLQHQVTELENNLQVEQQKSLRLSDKKRYDLVYAGGGIALISLIIGWFLARRKPKGNRW